eukprot:Selendium_serpulae@DN6363_c0_g1_i3.p1
MEDPASMSLCATKGSHNAVVARRNIQPRHSDEETSFEIVMHAPPEEEADSPSVDDRTAVRLLIDKFERMQKQSSNQLNPSSARTANTLGIKKDRACTGSTATTAASRSRLWGVEDSEEEDDCLTSGIYLSPRANTYGRVETAAAPSLNRLRPTDQEDIADGEGICIPMASFARPIWKKEGQKEEYAASAEREKKTGLFQRGFSKQVKSPNNSDKQIKSPDKQIKSQSNSDNPIKKFFRSQGSGTSPNK